MRKFCSYTEILTTAMLGVLVMILGKMFFKVFAMPDLLGLIMTATVILI